MYDPQEIEHKWQRIWQESEAFKTSDSADKDKQYVLDMFPYPSGDGLHVGHVRIYTASDIVARKRMMEGHAVLHPTGWDAFGLPAENYAIKTGTHPRETTATNIANIKRQMQALGFAYDWDREINTTDPNYYRWTQWIFLQMFKAGLAYEAEIPINWCPKDKTGLANEEVINGRCDRCGSVVEKRNMKQWVLKITTYADRLLKDLEDLKWPEKIKAMQRNWIGKSEGALVRFLLESKPDEYIEVFTTRPDTLFGATYVVLAPEHPLVDTVTTQSQKAVVKQYQEQAAKQTEIERTAEGKAKTGVFTGGYVINPVNGEKIPVWAADYVLSTYGTGAIMAVPAHDERDWEFAKKYDLPILEVIKGSEEWGEPYMGDGELVHSGAYNGMGSLSARKTIVEHLQQKGLAEAKVHYKLRDWVFSRQRYWGDPIPIIHCSKCGAQAVPEDQLPVVLPELDDFQPTGTGESPLAKVTDWVNTACPNCAGLAKRETDTMPQWAGSCWYYLRFTDPHNHDRFASEEALNHWLPVDTYIGGAEHAVLHLLYARFWHKFLYDQKLVPTAEPFQRLESVGIVLASAYKDKDGHYVHNSDVVIDGDMAFHKTTSDPLTPETEKMSKSKGNVVSPDALIEEYGADALRLYEMFMGPWDQMSMFDIRGMEGVSRFLRKADALFDKPHGPSSPETHRAAAKAILKVSADIEGFSFNTAVSELMIFVNHLTDDSVIDPSILETLALLLAPLAPHFAEEMWQRLGHKSSIFTEKWPTADAEKVKDTEVVVVLQVNGKVRGHITVPVDTAKEKLIELAKADAKVLEYLSHGELSDQIVVPNKLVNFVVK